MKLNKKILAGAAALLFAASSSFAASWDIDALSALNSDTISDGLADFADQLSVAVPQAATQQNVWADAWIGSLLPGIHLGGGFNFAMTNINTSGLAKAAKALKIDNVKDSYKFPVFTADLRVGGFILPFDADIAVMKTGHLEYPDTITGSSVSAEIVTFGFDFRYALLEGGLLMPKVSAGFGYFYNQGSFGISSDYAEADIDYKIHTMYLSFQASKEFSIPVVRIGLTPFVGGRLYVSDADNDWSYSMNVEDSVAAAAALAGYKTSDSGNVSSSIDLNNFQPQLYGGVGFNFALLQLTMSVSINPRTFSEDKTWSGALSLRVRH